MIDVAYLPLYHFVCLLTSWNEKTEEFNQLLSIKRGELRNLLLVIYTCTTQFFMDVFGFLKHLS